MPKPPRGVPQLSASDHKVALALASGKSQAKAGAAGGVTGRTVRNKLKKPEFLALVTKYQRQFISEAWGELASGIKPIVRNLKKLAASEDERNSIAASRAFGNLFIRIGVFFAHEARLQELEDSVKREKGES